MKQKQYNAFEIEFKDNTLNKEDFLNMDETDKSNYLDFLREKEIRLRERAENEKKRPKLVAKLNKDADKIRDFLQLIDEEREQKKEEQELPVNDDVKRTQKQQEARDSYLDPGINKQINTFIEQNGLEGHRIFYSRATGQLIDNSAAGEAIATVKEKNGILTITRDNIIDQIKAAEQQALDDVKEAVGAADDFSRVYMVHKKNGNNTIYADFQKGKKKETLPIREFYFQKTSFTKESREAMYKGAEAVAERLKERIANAVLKADQYLKEKLHLEEEKEEALEEEAVNEEEEKEIEKETEREEETEEEIPTEEESSKPILYMGKDISEALQETKNRHEIENEDMIFHVDGMDFDMKNIKGYTLIAIDQSMNLKGFDPQSLTVLYDSRENYGFVVGNIIGENADICVRLGDIDVDKNIEYLTDRDIYEQIEQSKQIKKEAPEHAPTESRQGVTGETIKKPETEKMKETRQKKVDEFDLHAQEFDISSTWKAPAAHEMDAIKVVCSKEGDFFATLDSDGNIHDGKSDHVVDATSDVGKNLIESLDQIAIASGVERDNLVIVDGCSYVTTTDGRQVGILSPDGEVLATEIDIQEQQILFNFAKEHSIALKDIDTNGKVIFNKENQTILAEFHESVQENILSGDKLEINLNEKAIREMKEPDDRTETVEQEEKKAAESGNDRDTVEKKDDDREEEEVPFDEAFDFDMDFGDL